MAQDQATFEFPKFKITVQYVGEENEEPAYETHIEAPGHEPMHGGTILHGPPLLSSAAKAAINEMRRLLRDGVKVFLEDYRANTRNVSFKELQNIRLLFLSWFDLATAIGEDSFKAAYNELKAMEPDEYRQTYGREFEPKEEIAVADAHYDLGALTLDVAVMGVVEGLPIWGVTARAVGTDLYANTIIGVSSPLALDAARGQVDNLMKVLKLGVEGYLAEEAKAKRKPIAPDKRTGTEMLYAVASFVGPDRLEVAGLRLNEMRREHIESLEDQATADMEQQIAEYRKKRPKA